MLPALQQQIESVTLEQYEALPEEQRAEVWEGRLYDMASPSVVHQRISMWLCNALYNYIRDHRGTCEVFHAPFDVKLCDEPLTIVQPDLMVICDRDKLDEKRCNGAPDLVIEIVSPSNPSHDYMRKLYAYKKYGVREYWIVDPVQCMVMVYFFESEFGKPFSFGETIKVNIYEDLYIDFSEIAVLL